MSREKLAQRALAVTGACLETKGYIAITDVLIAAGLLSREDYERWRSRQVPYLERVIRGSLPSINHVARTVAANCQRGGLRPSWTAYMSWGKGQRVPLRFSRTGDPNIERAYATHWLRPQIEHSPAVAVLSPASTLECVVGGGSSADLGAIPPRPAATREAVKGLGMEKGAE